MKCPHCLADLKYRDRRYSKKCPQCQRPFALEPRDNSLRMSDLRLRGLAERLSKQGKCWYTAAQLGCAAIRNKIKQEKEKQVSERKLIVFVWVSAGVAFILFFFVVEFHIFSFVILILAICFGILEYLRSRQTPLEEFQKVLEGFEEQFVAPWERIHGVLPGRVTAQEAMALRRFQLPPSQVRAVLASPVTDVLDCLRANGLPQRLGLVLINPDQPTGADEAMIALLRNRPRLPLLLVHDASVSGCLLPALLPARWGLAPNHRIVDLGLRPRHVQQLRLPWKREATPRELLNLLERRTQMPNGLALTPEERKWLRRGYATSALFIPPARLVAVVTQAVERLAPARVVDPEAQARAVGFMTWPS
ncbi:MAG: ABC transporter permease [Roseiflexus sp.]|jgi:hypothetical protein|nr:ABC transporter permease [Roseiflexus sp.]MBO9364785.1 ABC transporter permease [Roseiflexus sp.]MBO9390886.1 ABC transporter permease [Roseiflexus sp.]